jgi:uncharacterized protein (TIGR03032 family)
MTQPAQPPSTEPSPPIQSAYTRTFAPLLAQQQVSLLLTTYQAGKLIALRHDGNGKVETDSRSFLMPMGLAVRQDRFAMGTAGVIQEYRNAASITRWIEPEGKYDAAFVPRTIHATGDVQVHEMAWQEDELWFINTRFSCLCTSSADYSFIPQWQPKFISDLVPEDRCHLNGLAMVDGQPRYVTALGETDSIGGWRANKRNGGILIDIDSSEIISPELSMPHSPRWHDGKLWVLQSGTGGVGTIDLATGKYHPIIELPGFTRGLDFHGPYAFVGLSRVRESATFSGLKITELPVEKRACGVWVIDTRTGKVAAFLKFPQAVHEIFAVASLACRSPVVINSDEKILGSTYLLPKQDLWPSQ